MIGRNLVPLLVAGGHEVTAMTRSVDGDAMLRSLGAQPVMADALDRDSVLEAVVRTRPEAIIHQLTDLRAGNGAANATLRIEGTRNLVDAAHAAGVERVIAQSVAWAYVPGDEPADEQVPLDVAAAEPRSTTVRGVTALELAVREVPQWIVLRYGVLYGAGTWYAADGLSRGRGSSGPPRRKRRRHELRRCRRRSARRGAGARLALRGRQRLRRRPRSGYRVGTGLLRRG